MTNSGVPQFPQPGQYRPDTSQTRSAGNERNSIGQLERAPNEIRAEITERRQTIRAQGEVTRADRDGGLRISTPQGNIDVKLSADERHQQRPQVGDRVEVDIAPPRESAQQGQQAAQVIVRPAKPQSTDAPPTRASATPIEVEVRNPQTIQPPRAEAQIIRPESLDPNAPPPPNRFPETGSLVRLDPVSPAQLEQLVESRQLLVSETVRNALQPPPSADVLPVQNGSASITSSVITQPNAQVLNPPLPAPSQSSAGVQTILPPVISSLNIVSGNSEASLNVPILSRAQAAVAQLQNAASAPNAPQPTPTVQDARIGNIQAPQVSINAPGQTVSSAPQPPQAVITESNNAAQISGVVIAKTQAQVPIVQFSLPQNGVQAITTGAPLPPLLSAPLNPVQQQTYMLQFPSDALILGSRIDVTPQSLITSNTSAPTTTQALPSLPFANIAFPQTWSLMQDIQQSLLQTATQTAQSAAQSAQAFSASIPSPANASQFGPAALFFVAAMRGGDMGSWLGDKASQILRSEGKGSLISRLGAESVTLPRGADAPSGEWRGMNIPLMWEGDIQKIALHYKHDDQGDSDEQQQSGHKGTRFIFDLNLDVMGKVQLDGFFRPISENGPRLDVVLRTEERFSGVMQAEMRRVYMDAIKPSQVGGELSFQDGMDAWVMIEAQSEREVGVSA